MKARLIALVTALVFGFSWLGAQEVESLAVTNHSGSESYLINADQRVGFGGYDRHAIEAKADVSYPGSWNYQVRFYLRDSEGDAIPLLDGQGNTVSYIAFTESPPGATLLTYEASLRPDQRLNPYEEHAVEVRAYFWNPDRNHWALADDQIEEPGRRYYHFTNTDSTDPNVNVIAELLSVDYSRISAVDTVPGGDHFEVDTEVALHRYDGFNQDVADTEADIIVHLDLVLREAGSGDQVSLESSRHTFIVENMPGFEPGIPPQPAYEEVPVTVPFRPEEGIQLDSVNENYELTVRVRHVERIGERTVPGNNIELDAQQLLHFNGTLLFDNISATIDALNNDPQPISSGMGYVGSQLEVPEGGGWIDGSEAFQFSESATLDVQLLANGNAQVVSGQVAVAPSVDPDEPDAIDQVLGDLAGLRFQRMDLTLSPGGLDGNVMLMLPGGLGYRAEGSMIEQQLGPRAHLPFVGFSNVTFTQEINPESDLQQNAGDVDGTPWFFDQSWPVTLRANSFTWNLEQGRVTIDPAEAVYVREEALAFLEQVEDFLVNPDEARRASNEHYFRFLTGVEGDAYFEAGSDGGVRSTFTLLLGSGDYEPHFPKGQTVSWQGTGRLEVADGRVDPTESYLNGVDPLALAYGQDCPEGGCSDVDAGEEVLVFLPDNDRLFFTRNGGIQANGVLEDPAELKWGFIEPGAYAHETDFFFEAAYHTAGVRMESGLMEGEEPGWGAAAIHLAGVDADDLGELEMPETEAYRNGLGDYAGLNFRVAEESVTMEGRSRVGGVPTEFDLTQRSKYYVRDSGVSGIHEAELGTFPDQLQIYGYDFEFTNYGLSFLSSQNEESRTNGNVDVPEPSRFVQDFEELTLTCLGDLDKAEPPEADEEKRLDYWAADFRSLAIRFARLPDPCAVTGILTIAVDTGGAAFEERLAGELGFFPTGDLTAAELSEDDIVELGLADFDEDELEWPDSRLPVPAQMRFAGPDEETYILEPVSKAYFNRHVYDLDGRGFLSVAGGLGVPFFQAIKVHVHTRGLNPQTEGDPPYLAGGWPDYGWTNGDDATYFSSTTFDPEHRGSPEGFELAVYRGASGQQEEQFLPRALQDWLGVVPFNYPLTWDRITRSFESFEPETNDLLVLEINHQVDYLSAENAELTFGAQYDGLPRISIASTAFNALDEQLGVAEAMAEAMQSRVRDGIVTGLDDMAALLQDRMDTFLEERVFSLTDDLIDDFFEELEGTYDDLVDDPDEVKTVTDWAEKYPEVLQEFLYDLEGQTTSKLVERLEQLSTGIDDAGGILGEVDERLESVQVAIDAIVGEVRTVQNADYDLLPNAGAEDFERWLNEEIAGMEDATVDAIVGGLPVDEAGNVLENGAALVEQWLADQFPDVDALAGEWLQGLLARAVEEADGQIEEGSREIVQQLVHRLFHHLAPDLAGTLGPALDDATSSLNEQLNGLIEEADPALDKVVEVLRRVRGHIADVRRQIAEAEGIAAEIQDRIDAASEQIDGIAEGVHNRVDEFFDAYEAARPATANELENAVSPFDDYGREELKQMVRTELSDLFFASELVAEIHTAIKQRIYDLDAMAREAIDSAFQRVNIVMRDLVSDALADIESEINGLLGDLETYVGAGEIDGYAHINGDALRRLRLDGRFEWQVPDELVFRGYLQIEQLNSEGSGGCQFDVDGSVTEVTLGALDVGLGGLGGDGLRADVGTKFSFATGPFAVRGLGGSLVLTDGELEFEAFAITEFGAAAAFGATENYLSASTRLEFSEYELAGGVFFGRTCTLDPILIWDPEVEQVVTDGGPFTGGYVYGEGWIPISEALLGIPASCMFNISAGVGAGAFYFMEGPTYGGRIFAGVSGEALCAVSVKGELRMTGVKQGDDINFSGKGTVSGKAGKCRFCLKFEKTVRATYKAGEWDLDM